MMTAKCCRPLPNMNFPTPILWFRKQIVQEEFAFVMNRERVL
jgi:hypothetical protein